MKKSLIITVICLAIFALMFIGCIAPTPNNCPEPDGTKITASRGTAGTGGMIISGQAGAVEPGATVTVTDGEGNTATTTADANGGFTLLEGDLPMDFDHTIGNTLSVTQKSEGCNESSAVSVPISP